MSNSYFIYSSSTSSIKIKKFHICTWELNKSISLVELGGEIDQDSISQLDEVSLSIYVPWINEQTSVKDLYPRLRDSKNSKFIFNDSIATTYSLDGGNNNEGVIHTFSNSRHLCILPVASVAGQGKVDLSIDLSKHKTSKQVDPKNVYFRILLETESSNVLKKKRGIGKSAILYDIQLNELRNLPEYVQAEVKKKNICEVETCYCFNIIPDRYSAVLSDLSLRSIRSLEFESFKNYLGDERLKKNELLVVFNKKEAKSGHSFFSIYNDEIIGSSQIALAFLTNLFCGILLFIPSYRKAFAPELTYSQFLQNIPLELLIAIAGMAFMAFIFFRNPKK